MLDENLPTFHYRPSSENPHNTILHLTHYGSDPSPAFLLRRPDPALSASKNRYALAVADPSFPDLIYAEILLEPEWQQPSLSAAELRSQNALAVPPTPLTPDSFTLQLYNPDQQVLVKRREGGFAKTESWEFEMPERSFRTPSASRIDRDAAADQIAADLVPKVLFKWKRDGRISKDMTCYLVGKSVQGRKSKEPDITIGLFQQGRSETALTVYEPNMQRVEVEDRKGLEVVLVLGAEAIRDLYLSPRADVFNTSGGGGGGSAAVGSGGGRRKNSKPTSPPPPSGPAMAGALHNAGPGKLGSSPPRAGAGAGKKSEQWEIDAETKRLQAMVADEERQAKERERRDKAEQERIKKMLEREEKERRKRQAQIDKETEELRKQYGMQGQTLPSGPSSSSQQRPEARPALPPRRTQQSPPQPQFQPQRLGAPNAGTWGGHAPPPRPLSAGPYMPSNRPQQTVQFAPPPQQAQSPPGGPHHHHHPAFSFGKHQKRVDGLVSALSPYAGPAAASVSGFFHGGQQKKEDDKKKVQKKRSVHF